LLAAERPQGESAGGVGRQQHGADGHSGVVGPLIWTQAASPYLGRPQSLHCLCLAATQRPAEQAAGEGAMFELAC
jgi:hypothetical protein